MRLMLSNLASFSAQFLFAFIDNKCNQTSSFVIALDDSSRALDLFLDYFAT